MADSTHLKLPYIDANQAQKHVTHNEAVRLLDALVQMAVISRTLTTPPGSPADGDRYIVASGATGAWVAWDLTIAYYVDGAWMKLVPQQGWLAWIEAESVHVRWDGSAWGGLSSGGSVAWGSITGTLSSQTDLQSALNGKAATGHTHPSTDISDSTAAGRALLTAADAAAQTALLDTVSSAAKGLAPGGGTSAQVLKGDGTWSTVGTSGIANDAVSNTKLANMGAGTLKGNNTGATADPLDLTATQVTAMLDTMVASGASAKKGLAPAPPLTSGTVLYLREDGTWADFQLLPMLGVNATADATNKLAVKSGAILFDNIGNGIQAKLNKNAAADTASYLFQTGYSGRAEFGLTGDDDFHVKVSADGSAWTEALLINRTTGIVTLTNNSVANAALADMLTNRFKGRTTAGSGDPEDLTGTQATALLDIFTSALKGLAPASGGGTTNFLRADGTWSAPSGGGGSGDVVGPASATDNALARFDSVTGKLIQNGAILATDNGELWLPYVASPAAPGADKLNLFAGKKAARMLPRFMGPSGLDVTVQPLIAANKIAWWNPPGNATTVPGVVGLAAPTALGTATARNVASTSLATRARRLGYVSAATAGSLSGHYSATAQFTIGATGGIGGFFYVCRFVVSDAAAVSGARMFVGLRNAVAAPTNVEPSSGQINMIGVAQISSSNNFQIVYGGSAAQAAIDLGASFPANTLSADLYELALFAPPDTQAVHYQVTRVNTGDTAAGTLSGTVGTAIPAATTFLAHSAWRGNNATALAVGIDVVSVYIETDN